MRVSWTVWFRSALLCALGATNLLSTAALGQSWPQWAHDQRHTGFINVTGQGLNRILANIVYDPLVPSERAATGGDLLVHYQTPLVDGSDVYMESKSGTYTTSSYSTQRWHQNKFTWQQNGQLALVWTFDSDWVAPGSLHNFWEPVYHAVLANGFIYDPGAGGTIFKLNKSDGSVVTRINPFDTVDSNTYTASPLSTDNAGNIYYNIVRITGGAVGTSFYAHDVVASWLVRVAPDDSVTKVSYDALLRTATIIGEPVPDPNDPCKVQFPSSQLPWPPSPDAVPSTTDCGSQRAALNVAPAIAPDGTIYTVSRGHFVTRYSYLIAVNSDLTGKWASSLRGHLHDGCHVDAPAANGSILPPDGAPGGCRVGAHDGVDPGTNEPGPGRVLDDESATPTVAPDGSIFFGAYTLYNYAQGHLMHFDRNGNFLNAFNFGWDTTVAIYQHGGTYSVITKNNHYNVGSYCGRPTAVCGFDAQGNPDRTGTNPTSPEAFFVTQLSPSLAVEWSFQNTNTLSCTRNPDGTFSCVSDHPHSFEWCVNAPVVDANGVVYANSEDGNLFAINQGGTLRQSIFQQLAVGAAYTPASFGSDGKIYSQNAGHLFVVGN